MNALRPPLQRMPSKLLFELISAIFGERWRALGSRRRFLVHSNLRRTSRRALTHIPLSAASLTLMGKPSNVHLECASSALNESPIARYEARSSRRAITTFCRSRELSDETDPDNVTASVDNVTASVQDAGQMVAQGDFYAPEDRHDDFPHPSDYDVKEELKVAQGDWYAPEDRHDDFPHPSDLDEENKVVAQNDWYSPEDRHDDFPHPSDFDDEANVVAQLGTEGRRDLPLPHEPDGDWVVPRAALPPSASKIGAGETVAVGVASFGATLLIFYVVVWLRRAACGSSSRLTLVSKGGAALSAKKRVAVASAALDAGMPAEYTTGKSGGIESA